MSIETSRTTELPVAGMPVTAEEYEQIALADPSILWELHRGRLREKPGMTWDHTDIVSELGYQLRHQLDRNDYRVHLNGSRLRRSTQNYYVPDIAVVPIAYGRLLRGRQDKLEVMNDPLPLVVEVWSPSTGAYDLDEKIPEYKTRGDLEIWRLHPYERTLTVWRRQPDGSYAESVQTTGIIEPAFLPGVSIALDVLFDV